MCPELSRVHPRFGWEQSGREIMTAVAGAVYRLWARHMQAPGLAVRWRPSVGEGARAGTWPAPIGDLMGLAGRGLAGHVRSGTCYECRHPVDEARHGLGGALPLLPCLCWHILGICQDAGWGGGLILVAAGRQGQFATHSVRRVFLGGALRGRSPRTREGRIGPTAQNCSF